MTGVVAGGVDVRVGLVVCSVNLFGNFWCRGFLRPIKQATQEQRRNAGVSPLRRAIRLHGSGRDDAFFWLLNRL